MRLRHFTFHLLAESGPTQPACIQFNSKCHMRHLSQPDPRNQHPRQTFVIFSTLNESAPNMDRPIHFLLFYVSLVSATALAQQASGAAPPAPPNPRRRLAQSEDLTSPGLAVPNGATASISPKPPAQTFEVPANYPTDRSDTASRVEDLMQKASSLVGQGDLSKAMELYNEALTIAPQYAEAYRQRRWP